MGKDIRKSLEIKEPDIWRPLADFLTDMIAKYADEMEFEKLPDPERFLTCRGAKENREFGGFEIEWGILQKY